MAGCVLLFLTANAWAQQMTLAWDPVNAPTLGGYRLYYGQSSHTYTSNVNVGLQATYTMTGLSAGQTYYFAVTAYDTSGGNESAFSNEVSATVAAAPPVAAFTGTPTTGVAPLTVAFTDTSTGNITSWAWNFGDATSSTTRNPSHTYNTPGTYTVSLTVTGPGGTNTITKTNYLAVGTAAPPVAAFTGTPTAGTAPRSVAFTDASTGSITSWNWNFGDATSSTLQHPSHTYSTPGTYTVSLTVTGPAGTNSITKSNYIALTADTTAPSATLTAPANGATVTGITTITATAADNVGVVGVQFLLDGVSLGTEQPGPLFTLPWTTTTVPNGTHTLSARARDAAGNTALAPAVTVTVANTAPSGLVAAYALDATSGTTATDASGNSNNGVLTNGPLFAVGKNGNGVRFDGVNDFVNLGNPASLQLTSSMTLSAWVNSSAFPVDDAAIISKRQSGNMGYQLDTTIDRGPRTIGLKISDAAGNTVARYGATAMVTNTWYHVTGVYDATNRTMHVYLNGQLDNGVLVGTVPASQPTSTQNVNLGQRPGSPGGYNFVGTLDDVRIYNRALTQAEIQTDMVTPVGGTPPADTTAPTVALTTPTTGSTFTTATSPVTLGGTATDNVGVTQVTWSNDRGGSGLATGTTTWTASGIVLQPGSNVLTITARDAAGNIKTTSLTITYVLPPVAALTGTPTSGVAPLAVTFTDTSTGSITAWTWDFGDATSSTLQNPSHTYTTPGTYTVRLTATGPGGANTVTQTNYITVVPPAPVAALTGTPTSGVAPLTVAFTDASTGSVNSRAWDFGDATSSTLQNPSHTYTTPGTYTVRLTVTGPGGSNTVTKTNYITVAPPAPVAAFSGTPTTGTTPLTVVFTDASTGSVTNRSWDFGDASSSTLQNPSHTYRTPGTYTVSLTVTGPGGTNTVTKTKYITVSPALFEAGNITIDYVWKHINFRQTFLDPIVVATPLSANDLAPATIRIQNVGPTGFDIRVQEWDYLDGTHLPETVSYLVMERGSHTLGTGIRVEAGRVAVVRQFVDAPFSTVTLTQSFAATPVVLTAVTSVNEASAVITRQRNGTPLNFQVALWEQFKNTQSHLTENVDYIAWEPSAGTMAGLTFEVRTTADVVTDKSYSIHFTETYLSAPMFLAGMQSTDNTDPATLRTSSRDTTQATIYIQEESSKAHNLSHTTEIVGYMIFMYQ